MSTTTATLVISSFHTDLYLGESRGLSDGINVVGDGSDAWDENPTAYLQNAADNTLTRHGYTRTTDWAYDTRRDAYVATITDARSRRPLEDC